MIFLQIGAVDITEHINIQDYEMIKEDMYNDWTDANGVEHRSFYRTRITGEATAGFASGADFSSLMSLLASAKNSEGYYSVTAYIQNTGTTETFSAYIETEGSSKWDLLNTREWHEIPLKITER